MRGSGLGVGDKSIGLGDIDGVNFAGVQALEARTATLQQQLEQRSTEVSQLRGEVAELRAQVQALLARDAAAAKP